VTNKELSALPEKSPLFRHPYIVTRTSSPLSGHVLGLTNNLTPPRRGDNLSSSQQSGDSNRTRQDDTYIK
jgi:hypothetical protein